MEMTINRLPCGDNKEENYILWVSWKDNSFDITIIHKDISWQGNASIKHLEQLSEFVDMTLEDYMNETRKALSTQNGALNFSYHIIKDQFVWKKVVENNIKIKFGFISLHETCFAEVTGTILNNLLEQNSSLQSQVNDLEKANSKATDERTVLMGKLVEYMKQKQQMERTLFSQFLVVLNRKKEVMQHVPQDNQQHNNGDSTTSNHYESDTEVEDTDSEGKDDESTETVSGSLFETDVSPIKSIPKRIGRQKRALEPSAGPSIKKAPKQDKYEPVPETSDTQDLWDDI